MTSTASVAAAPGASSNSGHVVSARKARRWAPVLRWLTMLAVAATAGVLVYRYSQSHAAPAVKYTTAPADRGPIVAKVTASGAVSAIITVQVGSQVSGRILTWHADFNTRVKKNELIAEIEPSLFKAAVEQAKANYAAARANYDKAIANRTVAERSYARTLALFEQNLASRADLDAAEAQATSSRADVGSADAVIEQTRAALDQALLSLSYTRIVSPIDGVVISRNIDVGQTVAASFQAPTLFTIAQDLTKMQVDTNVAEGDVGKIREGMPASFTVDAYPTRVFHGVVRQVRDNATTLQNVVTYDAVIDVDNSDLALRPTMTANCTFEYASKTDVTRIPNAVLRFKPDAATVAVMNQGPGATPPPSRDQLAPDQRIVWIARGVAATPRVVRIGIGDGMLTELVEGDVHPGDALVSEALVQGAKKGP